MANMVSGYFSLVTYSTAPIFKENLSLEIRFNKNNYLILKESIPVRIAIPFLRK